MAKPHISLQFNEPGEFCALRKAEQFLLDHGFSVGPGCAGEPAGIMFGDYGIAKWRNLTGDQREQCHGILTGDRRDGPVTVTIFDHAPHKALPVLPPVPSDKVQL